MKPSNTSLKGPYAIVTIGQGGQAPIAAVGVFNYDGNGNFSGISTFNKPGNAFGERIITEVPIKGTYTVNGNDGTGTSTIKFEESFEGGFETKSNFVIISAELINGVFVAQEVSFILRDLSPITGNYVTLAASKLPAEGKFSTDSFKGRYAYTGFGRGGHVPVGGIGISIYDGTGNFTISDRLNVAGQTFKERKILEIPLKGNYKVNENGTGTTTLITGDASNFVITKAEVVNGINIAKEFFFILTNLDPSAGNLITDVGKRLPEW